MKRPPLFSTCLGGALLLSFSSAFYLQQAQKNHFIKTTQTYQIYQRDLKAAKDNETFLKQHHKELQDLIKRGWLVPKSRLIAAETLHQWAATFNAVQFTFEPETIKELSAGYSFKISKIIIEATAALDKNFYEFIEKTLDNFPGILVLRKFSVIRHENLIKGEIIYEWVAMGESRYEE